MPAKKPSTPSPGLTPSFRDALADAFRELEEPIRIAYGASILLEDTIEHLLSGGEDYLIYKRFHLNEDQLTAAFFAVHQLTGMIRSIRAKYQESFELARAA